MDPFKQFLDDVASNAKIAADQAQSIADSVASNVAETASSVASGVADVASNAVSSAVETAGGIASAATDAVGSAIDGIGKGIEEHKQNEADKAAAILADAEEARLAHVADLESITASKVLDHLGSSPIPTTEENATKIKSTFPVPREQSILWADAEFDLRPSGIIATEKGVYVKTDAVEFALPFSKDAKRDTCSRLMFIPWEYFDPGYFAFAEGNADILAVDEACSERFLDVCQYMASVEVVADESYDIRSAYDTQGTISGIHGATAAIVADSETVQFAENHASVKNPGGHGEMAEEANTIIDRFLGYDAQVVGRDNAKDGADRIVNGLKMQTKYYNSARGTLESAFDANTGQYRYIDKHTNKAMQLEVPRDQYDRVLEGFKRKIEQGKVPGLNDPAEAEKFVRKGYLTYDQAVNLTKPGTIESLAYDAATGVVNCSCVFGISFVAAAFNAYRQTGDVEKSMQAGIAAGVQVFGIAFIQHMLISQVARTNLAGTLMTPSKFVVEKLGSKATQSLVNAIRTLSGKQAIYGAAASKQLAKMFRSNMITTAITLAVFSVPETYNLTNKRISCAQYVKNMSGLTGSVLGGVAGAVAAGAAAAKVAGAVGTGVAPGVGTAVGLVGGFVGGTASAAAINTVGGILYEGDDVVIGRLLNAYISCMSIEYMLDENELTLLTEELGNVTQKEFTDLFANFIASDAQETVIRDFLSPRFDAVVSKRAPFAIPDLDTIDGAFSDMLLSMN